MRVDFDLRKSVVFLGHADLNDADSFRSCGTGYIHLHKGVPYLVTAAHVAEGLGDDPFIMRVNGLKSGAKLLYYDPIDTRLESERVRWFTHSDSSVDLAVLPFHLDFDALEVDCHAIQTSGMVENKNPMEDAGCGDFCYVIGLFAKRQGKSQNLPVVHTGHIAMMPHPNELIETSDKTTGQKRFVEGYLVEISNLQGLSGAPVFVRSGVQVNFPIEGGGSGEGIMAAPNLKLLGVWQGSWDGFSAADDQRVPVGIGIVTPAQKLLEILDSPALVENRKATFGEEYSATYDSGVTAST